MSKNISARELKQKYPNQTKWIAQELYKAYMHDDYRNIYNYFQRKGKYDEEAFVNDKPAGHIISGPGAQLCYVYQDKSNKYLIIKIGNETVARFEQWGFGDNDISEEIKKFLDDYYGEENRFSEEQRNEWLKWADAYYDFLVQMCKRLKIQVPERMNQIFRVFKKALNMSVSEAKKIFKKTNGRNNYPLFDYGFELVENVDEISLCYNWAIAPSVRYGYNEFYNFDERDFKRFKEDFERTLELRVKGFQSERSERFKQIHDELLAKARARKEGNLKEEVVRLYKK